MILIALGLVALYLVIRWDVKADLKKLEQNIPVKHTKEAWERVKYLIPSFLCLILTLKINWDWWLVAKIASTIALMMSLYWEFFDGLYNLGRNKKWTYTGSNDSDDAKSDNFLQQLTVTQQIIIKIGFIAVSLTAYLSMFF